MINKSSNFEQRFAEILAERKYTQAEVARMAGISKPTLSRYATGDRDPKVSSLYAMANALNVSAMWLYGYDAPKDMPTEKEVIEAQMKEQFDGIYPIKELLEYALGASAEFNDVYFSDEDIESIIEYIRFKKHEKES